jgi:hypothetical protein
MEMLKLVILVRVERKASVVVVGGWFGLESVDEWWRLLKVDVVADDKR